MNTPQNITILGAGIMGLMSAYTLFKSGHAITIYDPKGFPADNASFMAGGMLAPYSEIEHMDLHWIEAGLAGIDIWRGMDMDTSFSQKGSLLIAHPEDNYILERFKNHLPSKLQTPHNPKDIEPALDNKFQNGLFLNEEAHVNPETTMNALCTFLENKIEFKTSSITPEDCSANWILDCRGMASDDPELRGVKGEIIIVRNPEFTLVRPVRLMHPRYPLYIVPRPDHTFMIGATVIETSDNQNVTLRSSMELMSALYALSPSFGDAEIIEIKAGIRPAYSDNLPRISINNNVISAGGLFRHGYLLAPVMAQCVTDHLAGVENKHMSLFNKGADHESHNQRAA